MYMYVDLKKKCCSRCRRRCALRFVTLIRVCLFGTSRCVGVRADAFTCRLDWNLKVAYVRTVCVCARTEEEGSCKFFSRRVLCLWLPLFFTTPPVRPSVSCCFTVSFQPCLRWTILQARQAQQNQLMSGQQSAGSHQVRAGLEQHVDVMIPRYPSRQTLRFRRRDDTMCRLRSNREDATACWCGLVF